MAKGSGLCQVTRDMPIPTTCRCLVPALPVSGIIAPTALATASKEAAGQLRTANPAVPVGAKRESAVNE